MSTHLITTLILSHVVVNHSYRIIETPQVKHKHLNHRIQQVKRVEKRRTHVTPRIQLQQRISESVVSGSVVRRYELTAARGNARPLFFCHRTCRISIDPLLKPLHKRDVKTIIANNTRASAHHKHYQRRRENARTEPRSA